MSGYLVSVVMATYAGDNFQHLEEAIDSVLKQTYNNLEFIIVVDGPLPDDRKEYFKGVAADPRVKVHHLPTNQGPSVARNVAIEMATGSHIAIMDADDISLPERIAHQLAYLQEYQLDVMSSALIVIDDEGTPRSIRKVPVEEEQVRALAPYRCPLHNPAAFGKASFFKHYRYNAFMRVSEDYDLWVRLLLDGHRLGNSPNTCVLYRQPAAATAKRIGLKYAVADFKVKTLALRLSSYHKKPFVLAFAGLSACVRLLPHSAFSLLYAYRTKKLNSKSIALSEIKS